MSKKKFTVRKSASGLGLFSNVEIGRYDFIIRYTGEIISRDEADRRGGRYLFTIKRGVVLDGKDRKNLARYINHSCRPNCYVEIEEDENNIMIYAKRHIYPGEELTYNYGKEYWEEYIGPKLCTCEKCEERRGRGSVIIRKKGGRQLQNKKPNKMAAAKRVSYHVVPDKDNKKDWRVLKKGAKRASNAFENKEKAVARAKQLAKKNRLGQVLVHNSKGHIKEEYTYGDDPRGSKG